MPIVDGAATWWRECRAGSLQYQHRTGSVWTRVCCVVVEVVAASASNGCVQASNLRMRICMEVLCRYQTDGEGFLEQTVTEDETWCHHFDQSTKRMSQEWRHPGSPRPKKARASATAGKVMLTVFVDIHGPLLMEWMPVGATINTQRYCDNLQNLRRAIKERPGKLSRGVLMLHDNAHPHAAHATRDTLRRFGWGVLDHPPYSPDLSPCEYHVFGPLKKTL
jgi:histone-lysine N-methyltransferase SETMAR